jgi:hypothetical protein
MYQRTVSHVGTVRALRGKQADLFSINALRVPQFMIDVDVHNARLLDIKELSHGSGWGTVPTPVF